MSRLKKILPEEFASKFRSKRDLYKLLSYDLHYHLPPYFKCPLDYLKKVLNGEKKIMKQAKIVDIIIPRYEELKVENVWPLVKQNDDIMVYFPDISPKELPDRRFMYSILTTLRFEQVKAMVEGARKNRALNEEKEDADFIHIERELYTEISDVMAQKTTKGKAIFLLKKSSNLTRKRKQPRKYDLQFTEFHQEEQKEVQNEGNNIC